MALYPHKSREYSIKFMQAKTCYPSARSGNRLSQTLPRFKGKIGMPEIEISEIEKERTISMFKRQLKTCSVSISSSYIVDPIRKSRRLSRSRLLENIGVIVSIANKCDSDAFTLKKVKRINHTALKILDEISSVAHPSLRFLAMLEQEMRKVKKFTDIGNGSMVWSFMRP